jgi:hypothetical protein
MVLVAFGLVGQDNTCECDPGGFGNDDDDFLGDDDDVADDDDVGDDDVGDDDDVVAGTPLEISGDVFLTAVYYTEALDGSWQRNVLEWTEINADGYPYGSIFVALTPDEDDSRTIFLSEVIQDVPANPAVEGSEYILEAEEWPAEELAVMAVADIHHDGVISAWDTLGYHMDMLAETDEALEDIDVFLDIEFISTGGGGGGGGGGGWVPGHHGGGGGGGDHIPVTLSGTVGLQDSTHIDATGASLVATFDSNMGGPYWMTLPGEFDGADQGVFEDWTFTVYSDYTLNVLGAWDWNNNGLFEPSDDWGATVDAYGDQINPWTIGEENIEGMTVQIPDDTAPVPAARSYVTISGSVTTDGSFTFGDLDPGLSLVIAAEFSPPPWPIDGSLATALGNGSIWGYAYFEPANAQGETIPYSLSVPPYTAVYLVAAFTTSPHDVPLPDFGIDTPNHAQYVHVTTSDVIANLEMTAL